MKNGMKRIKHFLTAMTFIIFIVLGLSSTCGSIPEQIDVVTIRDQTKSKMYADIMGFNDNVILPFISGNSQRRPHNLETEIGVNNLIGEIKALPGGANTAAFYALDMGLDRIAHVRNNFMDNDPNSRFYIIFLTDGLDNVSTNLARLNKRGNFRNATEYAEALQERMKNLFIDYSTIRERRGDNWITITKSEINTTNSFQSFVLLFKGDDIVKSGYTDSELNQLLMPFTGSKNAQRPPVIMSDNLNQLYGYFENEFDLPFSFVVPRGYEGQRIRMLLNAEANNPIWFEGDFVREINPRQNQEFIYSLKNITFSNGFSFENKDRIIIMNNMSNNSNVVPFTINNLRLNNRSYLVRRNDNVQQWVYDGNNLRFNSETGSTNTRNAYILFIMDTSLSFGKHIDEAKETVIRIINYINNNI